MKPAIAIIGLGNPGRTYERTRHNAGFRAVDALSSAFGEGEWQEKQKFLSVAQEARILTFPILLLKPQTFMNRSGEAVRKVLDFYSLDASRQLLVICDDIDIARGTVRMRMSGGPGTHNGLKSVVQEIGEQFPRIRIGCGPQPTGVDLAAWVLSIPPTEERQAEESVLQTLPQKIAGYVLNGESDQ